MTIADTLREARHRIEEPGKWGKGPKELEPHGDKLCIGQAITLVAMTGALSFEARQVFLKCIDEGMTIPMWNDAPERTHMEVLAAFDRAIAPAESAEEKT